MRLKLVAVVCLLSLAPGRVYANDTQAENIIDVNGNRTPYLLHVGATSAQNGDYVALAQAGTFGVAVTITGTATLVPEVSLDSTLWQTIGGKNANTQVLVMSVTATGAYVFDASGWTFFRMRISSLSSGSVTVSAQLAPVAGGAVSSGASSGNTGTSSSFGAALPATGTAAGFNDASSQMQAARTFDTDTGAGTENSLGVVLRKSASGGSVEAATSSNPLRVDPTGSTTQPISAASLPLPAGAATAAKQPALGTAGTASADVITVQGKAGMTAVVVDGSGVTQPVSGTVTANAGSGTMAVSAAALPLPSGAATSANQTNGTQVAKLVDAGGTNQATVSAGGALKTDGSAVTQPVSAASLPLPAGAATAAKQPALGTAGTASADVITVQGKAGMTAVVVDGSGVTQPVSGTVAVSGSVAVTGPLTDTQLRASAVPVTANAGTNLNTSALQLDATGAALNLAQASTTSGQTGPLNQTATTTAAPTYVTGKTNPLSTTTAGALRTDGSGSTQPVSGTVTANAGSGTFAVSAAALPLPSGAATSANQTNGTQVSKLVDAGGTNQATVSAAGAVKVDGSAVTQPVSAASLPLPTGAATDASVTGLQVTQGSTTSGQSGPLAQTATTTAAPTYVTGKTNPLSTTTAGALRTDASATTQPVSGTVTANAGSGTMAVSVASLPLPTGASTAAKQPALGTAGSASADVITVQGVASMTALKTDGSATTQPVSGTVTANAGSNLNTSALALSATQTDRTQKTQLTDGTRDGTVKAASTLPLLTDTAVVTTQRDPLPAGTNVIGHTINDSGSTTVVTGTTTVAGGKTNNNAAPGATNVGDLPAVANAAVQSWTEGNQVALSVDLSGRQRTDTTSWLGSTAPTVGSKTSANSVPVVIASDQAAVAVSGTVTANAGTNLNTSALALSATQTDRTQKAQITDGTRDGTVKAASTLPLLTDTAVVTTQRDPLPAGTNVIGHIIADTGSTTAVTGTVTVAGAKTNNSAAPGATNVGTLPSVATAAAPTYVEGNQAALSTDLGGQLRVNCTTGCAGASDTTGSGTLNAANATCTVTLSGQTGAGFLLAAGTLLGTIVPEISYDGGTTYTITEFDNQSTNAKVPFISFIDAVNPQTTSSIVMAAGASHARVRVANYISGTATCSIRATNVSDPSVLFSGNVGSTTQPPTAAQIAGWDGSNLRAAKVGQDGTVYTYSQPAMKSNPLLPPCNNLRKNFCR